MVSRVNTVAAEFRKVSNKQMAETTKRTIRENVSIMAQLVQKSDKTMELIQENDDLRLKEKNQKQHIEMLETTEKELAKKNHSNQKVTTSRPHGHPYSSRVPLSPRLCPWLLLSDTDPSVWCLWS